MNSLDRLNAALRNSPLFRQWGDSHPRVSDFVFKLLTRSGLQLTAGVLISAVCWFTFFGVVQDLLANDPLVQSDLRVIAFLQTLRSPGFSQVMLLFTALGGWQVITAGAIIVGVLMYVYRQWWWLVAMAACIAGEQLLSHLLKLAFHRDRPDLHNALIPAAGGSFPSGHALAGSVFYGFLACYFISQTRSWLIRTAVVMGMALLILGIAFSRVYLGVHWPSDVLGSLALGPAWVATVLLVLSMSGKPIPQQSQGSMSVWHVITGLGTWVLVVIAVFMLTNNIVAPSPTQAQILPLKGNDFDVRIFDTMPRFTEDITGAPIEPINAIFIGSRTDLEQALAGAGWRMAAPLGLRSGIKLLWAELRNQPDPDAPGVPAFLSGLPNEITFERATSLNSARERHHLHIWSTAVTRDDTDVWVGTVHLDTSGTLYRGLTYHKIDPDVDRERDQLLANVQQSSCLAQQHLMPVTSPMRGRNILKNTFFTDGEALEVELRCQR